MNTDAPWPTLDEAEAAGTADPDQAAPMGDRRSLIVGSMTSSTSSADPAFLLVAWDRVRGNRGARSAGVDGETAHAPSCRSGEEAFLAELRADLKARTFRPLPVRERMIPKAGGKLRRLGIPTVRDRVVQAALKLVLEPIFEADFKPCSYGFRPRRRAQDAIAEIHFLATRSYEWVLEGDITACFDEIDHTALMGRVRRSDRRQARPGAGEGVPRGRHPRARMASSGTRAPAPRRAGSSHRCSPTSPSRSSTSTSPRPGRRWARTRTRANSGARRGLATYRLVRYADDFVVLVAGTRAHAEALRDEVAAVLAPMGLRLSEEKTRIVHIDEGFDFLGFRIQRQPKRGTGKRFVYTYPSKKALASVKAKVRALTRGATNHPLAVLLHRLNPVLRGWTNYFRHGVSKATFSYLRAFTWRRVVCWLRHKHRRAELEAAPPPLPPGVVADGGRGDPVQPERGDGHPLPLPGQHASPRRGRASDRIAGTRAA